jgi:hypothetical protein
MSEPIMKTSLPCTFHRKHEPRSHVNEIHHVWPLGHGGPDIPENRVVICATGHNSVHQIISELILGHGNMSWAALRAYGKDERDLAKLGYDRIVRQAM